MCDYSLMHVNRAPRRVANKLERPISAPARRICAPNDPGNAVCVLAPAPSSPSIREIAIYALAAPPAQDGNFPPSQS